MSKSTRKNAIRKTRPQTGTVAAALEPVGVTDKSMMRQINELRKAHLTGKITKETAKVQIEFLRQQLMILGYAHKAADLQLKYAELDLEKAKHASREAGRLRGAEMQIGTADPVGYSAVVKRLNGNGASH